MKTEAIYKVDLTVPVQGGRKKGQKTGESKNPQTKSEGEKGLPHMHVLPNPQPVVVPDGSTRIPLDQIEIDFSIFPRASLDKFTVAKYTEALIRKEQLPPITVEEVGEAKYRVLKGVLRFEAYRLRGDLYTGKRTAEFYDEPLPPISEIELNSIPCFIDTVPPDIHPLVVALEDNLKHGKPLTSEDYKKVARQLYKDNWGAPIDGLAQLIKVSRKVFAAYVADLVEAFHKEKEELTLELDAKGVPGAKIARELKKKFPNGKGFSQQQVSRFLAERDISDKTNVEDNAGRNVADGPQTGTPKEVLAEDVQRGEEDVKSNKATGKPLELEVVCGAQSDTIMILGINSLTPHLQEKLRTEVAKSGEPDS